MSLCSPSSTFLLLLIISLVGFPPAYAQSPPASGAVVITEIMYAPPQSSNEFIELYNRSASPVNLGRLAYADANRTFAPVSSTDTLLSPGAHVVLVRDTAAFEKAYPSVDYLAPAGWDGLNNGGDTVILRSDSTGVLDSLAYAPTWGGANGHSLERIDPAGPSTPTNFGPSTAEAGATPGRRNSLYAPDKTAPIPVFAEQVESTNVRVTISEPVRPASVTPTAFEIESTPISSVDLTSDTVVTLTLGAAPAATSLRVRGLQDRVGNTLETAAVPLAHQPEEGEAVINEILFDPRSDEFDERPNQVEYVELVNRTSRPLTLNGLHLTDRPDEHGVADTLRVGRRELLLPHQYGVVAAAPEDARELSSSVLVDAFPDLLHKADSLAYLPLNAARLGLNNDGDLVRLHRRDGRTISEVHYDPDWHAAGLEETKGTSLERISATEDANASDNWTSSPAPAGGTPGTVNAVSLPPPEESPSSNLEVTPSPFSIGRDGATRIRYSLDTAATLVRVRIYDARGRKVRTLEDARLAGRSGELLWNGRDDAGNRVRIGIYVVLLEAVRAKTGTTTQLKAPVVVARPLN